MPTIDFTYTDEHGEDVTAQVPAAWKVCHDCDGEGRTLNENLRGAFTEDEFKECFATAEDRAEYMKRGHGIYGVACKTCKGRTTVAVPDMKTLFARDPKLARRYAEHLLDEAAYEQMCLMERRMGA